MDRAKTILTSTECDDYVLRFLGTTRDEMLADGFAGDVHWVEVAVRFCPQLSKVEADELMEPIMDFYTMLALRMESHLSLNAANIIRNTWTAARILSTDPRVAQEAANELLWAPTTGLLRLRPDQCAEFETAFLTNQTLVHQLQSFADRPVAVRVWQDGGRYAALFQFLGDRFCGAPDHVLDAESVHAQWKVLETNRRSLKFKLLNAMLKLRHYRFTNGAIPPFLDLETHIEEISRGRAVRYEALIANDNVHPRMVRDMPYQERFNLRAIDVALLRNAHVDGVNQEADESANAVDVAFSNYMRFLFEPHNLYAFTGIDAPYRKYVYITENKSVSYRDKSRPLHAIGRYLNVVWYEPVQEDIEFPEEIGADEEVLIPCAGDQVSLPTQEMSLAEMCNVAGYWPDDIGPDFCERSVELVHESRLLSHNIQRFESRRLGGAGWGRVVRSHSGVDIEHYEFENRALPQLTRMALARALQVRDGLTDDQRNRIWNLRKNQLVAALENGPVAIAAVAKAAAKVGPKAIAKAVVKAAAKAEAKAIAKAVVKAAAKAVPKAARGRGGGRARGRGRGPG